MDRAQPEHEVQRLQLLAFCKSKEQEQDLYKQQTKDMNAMSGKLSKLEKQFKSSIVRPRL